MAAKSNNQQAGGVNDFTIVKGFNNGYRAREDITTLPPGVLVPGSVNVLTNTHQRVGIRRGYTLDGQSNDDLAPIAGGGDAMGVFDWFTSEGQERNMRAGYLTDAGNDGRLQFRRVDELGNITWVDLLTGLTSVNFNFVTFYDPNSLQVVCLFVNGSHGIWAWNGNTTLVTGGANPTGIIMNYPQPGEDFQTIVSGGTGYSVGDVLTIDGGDGNATVEVQSTVNGTVTSANENPGSTLWAPGDLFNIENPDNPDPFTWAICQVDTVTGMGVVDTFTILAPGFDYTTGSGLTCNRMSGLGIDLTVDVLSVGTGAANSWTFVSDADHGTGYSGTTTYPTTGGGGTGALFRVQGTTSGTITKAGETWAEAGFIFGTVGTQQINVDGVTYTYQAQWFLGDTTTLYGVSPDPSGIAPGAFSFQSPVFNPNTGGSDGIPTEFNNDLIVSWEARVMVGSKSSSLLYLSSFTSYRVFDIAATIVLNNNLTALAIQQDSVYVSTQPDEWYQVSIELSADLNTRRLVVSSLNTASQQGAQSQAVVTKIANSIAYLSFEPIVETFGPVENILLGPQITDLSFPIVNDMNEYDFTGAGLFYFRKYIYVAVPRENIVLIYNMTDPKNPYWEAPQNMPISRFSVIEGELYGHSSQVSETYKLFTGTNDNGHPIAARAAFSFNNYGTRTESKGYNEFYVEGYISANTVLTLGVQYDIDGCATKTFFDIGGDDTQIVCIANDDASLGKTSLGKHPLGGTIFMTENPGRPKFRVIKTFPTRYFYEDQISFGSTGIDQDWEIICYGPQLQPYTDLNNKITQ